MSYQLRGFVFLVIFCIIFLVMVHVLAIPGRLTAAETSQHANFKLTRNDARPSLRPALASEAASTFVAPSRQLIDQRIATDPDGNIYVAATVLKHLPEAGYNTRDIFLAKFDPSFQQIFSIQLGGDGDDTLGDITTDTDGNVYLTGETNSTNFPILDAIQPTLKGASDAFLVKLTPRGGIVFSTYWGGALKGPGSSANDAAYSVAVDSAGSIYLAGSTGSYDFPTTDGAFLPSPGQAPDNFFLATPLVGFVTRFAPTGDMALFSTLIDGEGTPCTGGSSCLNDLPSTQLSRLHVNADGSAILAGTTNRPQFATTSGDIGTPYGGYFAGPPAFILKLNADGSALETGTLIAGGGFSFSAGATVTSLAGSPTGEISISGTTSSDQLPVTGNALADTFSFQNPTDVAGFVATFRPDLSELVYATYLTGARGSASGLAVDAAGDLYIAGKGLVDSVAVTPGGITNGGNYLVKLDPDTGDLRFASRFPDGAADGDVFLAPNAPSGPSLVVTGSSGFLMRMIPDQTSGGTQDTVELPHLTGIANAAGLSISPIVAPGEIISLYGQGLFDGTPSGPVITNNRVASQIGGLEVRIDGQPAPLLYASANQINAVAPVRLSGLTSPNAVEILRDGVSIASLPVLENGVAPGVFRNPTDADQIPPTLWAADYTPLPAAAINQDGTVNSFDNPAPGGSIVAIWGTGIGLAGAPVPVDGAIAPDTLPATTGNVEIGSYGGSYTPIQGFSLLKPTYAGPAPGMVTGAAQINFRVPELNVANFGGSLAQFFDIAAPSNPYAMDTITRSAVFTIFVGPPAAP